MLGATAACKTLVAAGTQAPADFQIMLKKQNMPLANSFTVVGGSLQGWGWEILGRHVLAKPRSPPCHRTSCTPTPPPCRLQLWCATNTTSCMTFRLSHPCFRGRCTVEADKTLDSGLFSSDPLPLGLK